MSDYVEADSRKCPCCGYDDEAEHIFDGTQVSCGCPCWWSVGEDGAYIAEGDEPCPKCLVEEVESLEKRIAELEASNARLRKVAVRGLRKMCRVDDRLDTHFDGRPRELYWRANRLLLHWADAIEAGRVL